MSSYQADWFLSEEGVYNADIGDGDEGDDERYDDSKAMEQDDDEDDDISVTGSLLDNTKVKQC
jgi:hypothetical protein